MISINAKKPEVAGKEPEKSLSQQKMLREAKGNAEKKMSLEKYDRLKRAGLVK